MVSGINAGDRNLNPAYFIRRYGSDKVVVIHMSTNESEDTDLTEFMTRLSLGTPDDPLKLKVSLLL